MVKASASDAASRQLALEQHARPAKRDHFVSRALASLHPIDTGETTMVSLKTLAAALLLSATVATPAFAHASMGAPRVVVPGGLPNTDRALYIKNLNDSGYNPKNDFNPNGTIRAAIQEPGLFAFYYPNLDVLNGGAPTPAARMSPNWSALKGACASAGGGVSYCGDRYGAHDFAPDAFPHHHGRRRHRS
jgi:hypothetical protein